MNPLTQQQFTMYARQQIDTAVAMLARHQDGPGYCSCGRELPCSVAEACHRTRDHYQGKPAVLDATAKLPELPSVQEPSRVPRWRRLLRGGR
jgi:hypothetical protein